MIAPARPTFVNCLRRGMLYGAALGLLLGLVNVGFQGLGEREAIVYWRDWILGGAAVGLLCGVARGVQLRYDTRRATVERRSPD